MSFVYQFEASSLLPEKVAKEKGERKEEEASDEEDVSPDRQS